MADLPMITYTTRGKESHDCGVTRRKFTCNRQSWVLQKPEVSSRDLLFIRRRTYQCLSKPRNWGSACQFKLALTIRALEYCQESSHDFVFFHKLGLELDGLHLNGPARSITVLLYYRTVEQLEA